MSNAFKDFLAHKGIKHQCTMPYTPQQNGVAERKNRSLMEMDRCMLKADKRHGVCASLCCDSLSFFSHTHTKLSSSLTHRDGGQDSFLLILN